MFIYTLTQKNIYKQISKQLLWDRCQQNKISRNEYDYFFGGELCLDTHTPWKKDISHMDGNAYCIESLNIRISCIFSSWFVCIHKKSKAFNVVIRRIKWINIFVQTNWTLSGLFMTLNPIFEQINSSVWWIFSVMTKQCLLRVVL